MPSTNKNFIKLSVMHLTTHCTTSQPAYQTWAYNFLYMLAILRRSIMNGLYNSPWLLGSSVQSSHQSMPICYCAIDTGCCDCVATLSCSRDDGGANEEVCTSLIAIIIVSTLLTFTALHRDTRQLYHMNFSGMTVDNSYIISLCMTTCHACSY